MIDPTQANATGSATVFQASPHGRNQGDRVISMRARELPGTRHRDRRKNDTRL